MVSVKITLGFTFLITLITLSIICYGQDTIYYDYSWKRVAYKRDAVEYCIYEPQPDKTFKGEAYSAKNNTLESIGYYSSIDPVLYEGHFIFYDNGSVTHEGDYTDNKPSGKWVYYFKGTKNIWYTETYGKRGMIKLRSYYPAGKLKRKEKHNDTYTKASGKCYSEKHRKMPFTKFYTAPIPAYPIEQYLSENLRYPAGARDSSIEGGVVLKYVINEDGNVTQTEVVKGIAGGCNQEAVRVISQMPKWSPAIKDDKKTKVTFYQLVNFHFE